MFKINSYALKLEGQLAQWEPTGEDEITLEFMDGSNVELRDVHKSVIEEMQRIPLPTLQNSTVDIRSRVISLNTVNPKVMQEIEESRRTQAMNTNSKKTG
jgi:hypothetical protein